MVYLRAVLSHLLHSPLIMLKASSNIVPDDQERQNARDSRPLRATQHSHTRWREEVDQYNDEENKNCAMIDVI